MSSPIDILNHKEVNSIYLLKAISAFLVICVHCNFIFKEYIDPITRLGVPFFLIISGFFIYDKNSVKRKGRYQHQLIKIAKITIASSILYILYSCFRNFNQLDLNTSSIWKFITFNTPPLPYYTYHLWYLYAYIYALLILLITNNINLNIKIYRCIYISLLIVALFLGKYSLLLLNTDFPEEYTRNFLFTALPFVMIGIDIKKNINSIKYKLKYITGYLCIFVVFATMMENLWIETKSSINHGGIYLFTPFCCVIIFLYCLKHSSFNIKAIKEIGKQYTLNIYILQYIVIVELSLKAIQYNFYNIYLICSPIVVFMTCYCLSILCKQFLKLYGK